MGERRRRLGPHASATGADSRSHGSDPSGARRVRLGNARAADILRESEQRFRAVAETAVDAIVSADRTGRVTYVNTAAQSMFGYDAEEVLGRPLTMLMPKRFRARHQRGLDKYLQSGDSSVIGSVLEVAGLRRDGSEFPIELSLATWTTHSGETAFTGIIRDISERYQAADSLRKAHAQLEARVAERTADLAERNRQLQREIADRERAETAQRRLLRELDHRVKNTLAAVQSVAIQTLRTTESTEEFSEAFQERINALARVHDALTKTQWGGLDIRDLIQLVLTPFHCGDNRITWRGDPVFLSASVVRSLGAALHELATNATKYGALSQSSGHVEIWWQIEIASNGRYTRIEWKESGGPTVDEPSRRGVGRTMIEDAIPHEAAGQAKLEFQPDGVRCEFFLPLPSEATQLDLTPKKTLTAEGAVAATDLSLAGVRVIIIEDHFSPAEALKFLLESYGCTIVGCAGTVSAALEIVAASEFDVAVLDVQLADEDIAPVAAAIHARRGRIVYLSGYADLEMLPPALRSFPLLSKPVEVDRLVAALARVTAKSPD